MPAKTRTILDFHAALMRDADCTTPDLERYFNRYLAAYYHELSTTADVPVWEGADATPAYTAILTSATTGIVDNAAFRAAFKERIPYLTNLITAADKLAASKHGPCTVIPQAEHVEWVVLDPEQPAKLTIRWKQGSPPDQSAASVFAEMDAASGRGRPQASPAAPAGPTAEDLAQVRAAGEKAARKGLPYTANVWAGNDADRAAAWQGGWMDYEPEEVAPTPKPAPKKTPRKAPAKKAAAPDPAP